VNNEDYIRLLKTRKSSSVTKPHGLPSTNDAAWEDKDHIVGNCAIPLNISALLIEQGCRSYFSKPRIKNESTSIPTATSSIYNETFPTTVAHSEFLNVEDGVDDPLVLETDTSQIELM
jgi:hypothetical protein